MNTKTDGISSGLVAVAWMAADEGGDLEFNTINKFSCGRTEGTPLVRLSDAEAKLSECVTSYEKEVAGLTAELNAKDEEIERLERESSACDLVEEQKGTITALNMALGGEDSTSTENLIDAYEVDYNEEGLISLCRKLIAENVRLSDVIESTAINDTIEALGFANREIERLTTSENDWITCHAKIWRELQETKTIVGNQAERISDLEASPISEEVIDILRSKIKALESEILEQCRINGMGAEREAALLGKVAQQSAALKLAREALQAMHSLDEENHQRHAGDEDVCTETRMCREALAAIDEVLKGE